MIIVTQVIKYARKYLNIFSTEGTLTILNVKCYAFPKPTTS